MPMPCSCRNKKNCHERNPKLPSLPIHPTCLNTPLNPTNPSLTSLISAPKLADELADDERCLFFNLTCGCGLGTSKNPFELEELRSRLEDGASEADDDEVEDASEDVDVLDMVGTMMVVGYGYVESLWLVRGGGIKLLS